MEVKDWALRKEQEALVQRLRLEAMREKRIANPAAVAAAPAKKAAKPAKVEPAFKPWVPAPATGDPDDGHGHTCVECGEAVLKARVDLGLRTCRPCGEAKARAEAASKAKRVVQMHKSNATYGGSEASARQALLDATRMRRG